jgi:hypothetical protein
MKLEMDRKTTIGSWTELGMTSPFDVVKSQKKAKAFILSLDFWA